MSSKQKKIEKIKPFYVLKRGGDYSMEYPSDEELCLKVNEIIDRVNQLSSPVEVSKEFTIEELKCFEALINQSQAIMDVFGSTIEADLGRRALLFKLQSMIKEKK